MVVAESAVEVEKEDKIVVAEGRAEVRLKRKVVKEVGIESEEVVSRRRQQQPIQLELVATVVDSSWADSVVVERVGRFEVVGIQD